jgi:hypothetical protein
MLYKVDCPDVMKLEIPTSYTGYDKIQHYDLHDDIHINKLLCNEVKRIKKAGTYEAILYCIDRKIMEGHDRVLKSLSETLKCVINTYNGQGITAYMRTVALEKKFESRLKKMEINYTKNDKYFQIKNMSIRKFYSIVKKIGENCVVTIGKDLICRGISYVSEDQHEPITATTMFYKPGSTMHAVGITQTIGRITGCAMPNLERRLYAPKDVYDTYINYNKNQELYISKISNATDTEITKDIIDELIFERYTRNVDRMKLDLKMKMKAPSNSDSESELDDYEDEEDKTIDGVNLEKLRKWMNGHTLVGRMIKCLYKNETEMTFEEFKESIEYDGTDKEFKNNICGGRGQNSQYGKLWYVKKNTIRINKNIKRYIDKIDL